MAENSQAQGLLLLLARSDIPQDARSVIQTAVTELNSPIGNDVWIYRAVVAILGVVLLATVLGGIWLAFNGHGDQTIKLPDAIVAIGSAAVGALAGLLAPSPVTRGQ